MIAALACLSLRRRLSLKRYPDVPGLKPWGGRGQEGRGTRGGPGNGPYADSLPVSSHFQGGAGRGGGGGGWVGGVLGASLGGGGGAPGPQQIWLKMTALSH